MKYVVLMGYVYRLSERNYRQLLRAVARDESPDLDKLGKQLFGVDLNITDLSASEAQMELDSLASERAED